MGGAARTGPLWWPPLGKGQAQARVRASGARHLVCRSEPSIQSLTQQRCVAVTLWAWHSTFALTSWPPVTAAADRLGWVSVKGGRLQGGEGINMIERWVRREDEGRGNGGVSEVKRNEWNNIFLLLLSGVSVGLFVLFDLEILLFCIGKK